MGVRRRVGWLTRHLSEPGRRARPRSWQEMREQEIRWLIERTGDGLETWNARVIASGLRDETSLRVWLTEKGVTGSRATADP